MKARAEELKAEGRRGNAKGRQHVANCVRTDKVGGHRRGKDSKAHQEGSELRSKMQTVLAPTAKVSMMIRKPVADVYQAFVDPAITTKFWFTSSTGRLDERQQVRWKWEMYGVHSDVDVVELEPNERIVITWSGYQARERVEWTFVDRGDGTTYVTIEDSGFAGTPEELAEQAVKRDRGIRVHPCGGQGLARAWPAAQPGTGQVPGPKRLTGVRAVTFSICRGTRAACARRA